MAEGINIKVLPESNSIQGNDKILIDRPVTGTRIVPFSAVVVNETQVTFYSSFLNLSSSLNQVDNRLTTDLNSVSGNLVSLSSYTTSSVFDLNNNLDSVSTRLDSTSSNLLSLSSNTTTFISGGISPSGLFIPAKVGILYFASDTKDYFLSIDNVTNRDWKRILTVNY